MSFATQKNRRKRKIGKKCQTIKATEDASWTHEMDSNMDTQHSLK